jgi:hypothetical protein
MHLVVLRRENCVPNRSLAVWVEENLKTLEAPVQYLYKQKMIERTVSVDDLLLPV